MQNNKNLLTETIRMLSEEFIDFDINDEDAEKIEKAYKDAYNKYVELNPKNHLNYNDWLELLPISVRSEIEDKIF